MDIQIEHWDAAADGTLSETALRAKLEARGFRVTRYVYPAGAHFPTHTHAVDKLDAVLSGRFLIVMGGRRMILEAGDMLFVPRGAAHSAEVLGEEAVVSLDAVKV